MGVDVLSNLSYGSPEKWSRSSATITAPTPISVKRSLFGVVDHDEAMGFIEREFEKIVKEKSERYNFDFHNEVPLTGKFKWEKIEIIPGSNSSTCTRSAVARSPIKKVTKSRSKKRSPLKNKVDNTSNNKQQSRITDFLIKSKRPTPNQ